MFKVSIFHCKRTVKINWKKYYLKFCHPFLSSSLIIVTHLLLSFFMRKFKACICYFLTNCYLSPNYSPSKTMKDDFFSSIKLFSFSRYLNFCISIFPSCPLVSHCFRAWSKIYLKVYDVISCLNKTLILHFIWYLEKEKIYDIETLSIDRVLNKENIFYAENIHQKLVPDPFIILVRNPKQPLHARNSFRNKILSKGIIKSPWKS